MLLMFKTPQEQGMGTLGRVLASNTLDAFFNDSPWIPATYIFAQAESVLNLRVAPTRADGDADSEPPARSPPKERATKSKKQSPEEQPSTLERNVPLEMAPSSADASEVAAKKKKKKKDGKKRSREETFMEPAGTSAAMGSDDMGRLDPIDSTRGSSEGCPKKKTRRTAAGDEGRRDGTPVPEGPSKSGGGSQDGSPSSKRAPSSAARGKDASDPPAQVEDLDAQAVEEETAEPLAPSRDDQDIVV
ncbi:hypothetical protein Bca4012_089899 [Brassica carinata]